MCAAGYPIGQGPYWEARTLINEWGLSSKYKDINWKSIVNGVSYEKREAYFPVRARYDRLYELEREAQQRLYRLLNTVYNEGRFYGRDEVKRRGTWQQSHTRPGLSPRKEAEKVIQGWEKLDRDEMALVNRVYGELSPQAQHAVAEYVREYRKWWDWDTSARAKLLELYGQIYEVGHEVGMNEMFGRP